MAHNIRGRRTAFDNIAQGSATGAERTIAGDTVSKVEMPGGGYRTSTSTGDEWHSNITPGVSVSNDAANSTVASGALAENIVAAGTTNTEENPG